tara:strand:+ start:2533 stop:3438 length:906 start_codon:yes stop_codon:yes gene_type:complete
MFNIFKKKKKWVRFYCLTPGIKELHPWIPAVKLKRKWQIDAIKKHSKKENKCPVLKVNRMWDYYMNRLQGGGEDERIDGLFAHAATCPALSDLFRSGWVMTAPADILIKVHRGIPPGGDKEITTFNWVVLSDVNQGNDFVKAHIPEQTDGMRQLVDQQKEILDTTIKLELPWRVQSHPDIVFLQIPVPYWDEDRFTVPTGIVDTSYSYEVNLQMFWHKIDDDAHLIKAGTPLCQWIPIEKKYLDNNQFDVIIEDANQYDIENNKIMDYARGMNFMQDTTLKERIGIHKHILSLNKNNERFN